MINDLNSYEIQIFKNIENFLLNDKNLMKLIETQIIFCPTNVRLFIIEIP